MPRKRNPDPKLCPFCRCRHRTDGYATCQFCRDQCKRWAAHNQEPRRIYRKIRYDSLKAQGLCITCTQPTGGTVQCSSCIEKARETRGDYNKRRHEKLKSLGLCIVCTKPANAGARCRTCADRASARRALQHKRDSRNRWSKRQ